MKHIQVTLRNGGRYRLAPDGRSTDAERLFGEVMAGRSQALRGWVAVEAEGSTDEIVVQGEEIVELRLVGEGSDA